MKKVIKIFMVTTLGMCLAACGSGGSQSSESTATAGPAQESTATDSLTQESTATDSLVQETTTTAGPTQETDAEDQTERDNEQFENDTDDDMKADLNEAVAACLDVEGDIWEADDRIRINVKNNSIDARKFLRYIGYLYEKFIRYQKRYEEITFCYNSDLAEGKFSFCETDGYGDYYVGQEVKTKDGSDSNSDTEVLDRIFDAVYKKRDNENWDYFWIFTNFDPDTSFKIEDGVCYIGYTCGDMEDRTSFGEKIYEDSAHAEDNYKYIHAIAPSLLTFDKISIQCRSEEEDFLFEYDLQWNDEEDELNLINLDIPDSEIEEGFFG